MWVLPRAVRALQFMRSSRVASAPHTTSRDHDCEFGALCAQDESAMVVRATRLRVVGIVAICDAEGELADVLRVATLALREPNVGAS